MEQDINKLRTQIADFIHISMCIDGLVKFECFETIELHGEKKKGMVFEVTDSIRGTFYIGWYK